MAPGLQNSSKEEELARLLELKLIPDSQRTQKQQLEMNRLKEQHKPYAQLNGREMQRMLQNKPSSLALLIQSPANSALITQDYDIKFASKPGYQKPSQNQGMQTVQFSNEQDAADFLLSQASKGRKFRVLNAQNTVLAVSNGKGVLQHSDGRPFNARNSISGLVNTSQNQSQVVQSNPGAVLANNRQVGNQPSQQFSSSRPNMTAPRSTMTMKLTVPTPMSHPTAMKPVPGAPAAAKSSPAAKPKDKSLDVTKTKIIQPTPFKKTPYDY